MSNRIKIVVQILSNSAEILYLHGVDCPIGKLVVDVGARCNPALVSGDVAVFEARCLILTCPGTFTWGSHYGQWFRMDTYSFRP
jgi:hypothetical protein